MTTYIIYGLNAIRNLLYKNTKIIKKLYIFSLNYRVFKLIKLAENKNVEIYYCNSDKYNRFKYLRYTYCLLMSVVDVRYNNLELKEFLKKNNIRILMLYKVQDPHNLASCIRSCEALGFDFLVITKKNTAKITTLVHNLSHATSLVIPIFSVRNVKQLMYLLKKNDIKIIGLSIKAKQNISTIDTFSSFIIIMGSEKCGINSFIMKQCTMLYKIPTLGVCNSINVSVATGIILYHCQSNKLMTTF